MSKPKRSPAELRSMFGKNLRQLADRYPSVSELARQLDINRTQFNRYLSGESFPRPDVLDKICTFFDVDARILLDPVDELANHDSILNGPYLQDFLGFGLDRVEEQDFPSGIYRFTRRSFTMHDRFLVGLVRVFRRDDAVFIRGYESREAMAQLGFPTDPQAREFRGYVSKQEDGIAMIISRRHAMTCSFNYLAPVTSFENNFWLGYVVRPVREDSGGARAVRMVYEHLGTDMRKIIAAGRDTGFVPESSLLPFQRRLLRTDQPFR